MPGSGEGQRDKRPWLAPGEVLYCPNDSWAWARDQENAAWVPSTTKTNEQTSLLVKSGRSARYAH